MRRFVLTLLTFAFIAPLGAVAQTDAPRVDVIEVSGVVDEQLASFLVETIEEVARRGTEVIVLQIDSRAVVVDGSRYAELLALVSDPPEPLVAWVGPAPASAFGGVAELVAAAPLSFAAPGVRIGNVSPLVATDRSVEATVSLDAGLDDRALTVSEPIDGLIDGVVPTASQVVQALHGSTIAMADGDQELATLTELEVEGEQVLTTGEVVFHEPGYWTRFVRLGVSPEAAFLFLALGLTVAAFEFYAIGPGLAAAAAALALFLAGYGITALPLHWWAIGLVVSGWALLTASYQMGTVPALVGLGAVFMAAGGLMFTDSNQIPMSVPVTIVIVAGMVLFYLVAMPTVARSRFSTRTIGRQHLIGRVGVAITDFERMGEVEVDGAMRQAAAHREAGIRRGDAVAVVEVDGSILEVEPVRQSE